MEVQQHKEKWSYSAAEKMGIARRVSELWSLYRSTRNADPGVDRYFTISNAMNAEIFKRTGKELRSLKILDIGPGQNLGLMHCLSKENQVVGIDTDVILQDLSFRDCARMLKRNTCLRVVKTLGRKALGIDASFRRKMAQKIGVPKLSNLPVHWMDATSMSFPNATFDLVYSFSTLEHIETPAMALSEVARVLKPGGVGFLSIHLYTSHSGCHIPEMLTSPIPQEPYWPHLRLEYETSIRPTAYLNKIRLQEWIALFREIMPNAWFIQEQQTCLKEPLENMRAKGQLSDYTDDELLTVNLIAIWQKGNEKNAGSTEVAWVP